MANGFTNPMNSSCGIAINDAGATLAIGAIPTSTSSYSSHFQPFTKGDLIAHGFNLSTASAYTRHLLLNANPVPSLTYTGTVSNAWNTTIPSFTPFNYSDGSFVTFDDTATGSTTVSVSSAVSSRVVTLNNGSRNYVINGNTVAGGANVGLPLKGAATVTLNNPNTFSGTTTLNSGDNLLIGSTDALASNNMTLLRNASFYVQSGGVWASTGIALSLGANCSLAFAPTNTGKVALRPSSYTNHGSTPDLGNSGMVVHNSDSASIFSAVANSDIISN